MGLSAPVNNKAFMAVESWMEHAVGADNASVTVTKADETGKRHYVTSLTASFVAASAAAKTAALLVGAAPTTEMRFGVTDTVHIDFPVPIMMPLGDGANAGRVQLQLAAGGAGSVGQVTITGITLED